MCYTYLRGRKHLARVPHPLRMVEMDRLTKEIRFAYIPEPTSSAQCQNSIAHTNSYQHLISCKKKRSHRLEISMKTYSLSQPRPAEATPHYSTVLCASGLRLNCHHEFQRHLQMELPSTHLHYRLPKCVLPTLTLLDHGKSPPDRYPYQFGREIHYHKIHTPHYFPKSDLPPSSMPQ